MYNLYNSSLVAMLPPQMIPLTEKTQEWKENTMDALERIGRSQYNQNLKLIENYEMIKGKFIFNHYFETEGYNDMLGQLTREFDMPTYLRHYDIISQVINTMSGEYQKRPDNFRVRGHGEEYSNEYVRQKSSMLIEYVQAKIDAEINAKLAAMGIDPNKSDFNSPQEQQQYQQQVQQKKQALTPPEIQKYMDMTYLTTAEMWGQSQLELDKDRFRLDEKEKVEFEDMLVADRCFRHFYLTSNGYEQETWNPVTTFFHRSPEVPFIEEGDFVGRCFYLTTPSIIDRYGYFMTKKQIEDLQGEVNKNKTRWNEAPGTDYVYKEYLEPFKGARDYTLMQQTLNFKNIESQGVPFLDQHALNSLYNGSMFNTVRGFHLVTEAYWKSQKKVGKVIFIDPETGLVTKMLVDENVIIPEDFKQKDSTFDDREEPNTVIWTWINEVWKGKKISRRGVTTSNTDDIYFDIAPLEFQFKGDINPYKAKLPVCGQVFSIRNSQSMSLVDLMKPFQIGHNVAMNQLYQIMEREVGRFIVMDVNMFPSLKDWGGEKGWEKAMLVAKSLGMFPADTSPQTTKGSAAAAGGQYPKMIDLDESARMVSRINIANSFEQFALKQIGFNEYRLGQQAASSTAKGVEVGQQASYAQTESYFTNFSNYKRRCLKMDLDIAQFVQSKEKDITVSYIKSDMSRAFVKLNGTDLMTSDLHVYVSNSQEQIRQLEMLRQLALENNTSGATIVDLANIISMNSPSEIKLQLEESLKSQQAREDKQTQLQQQQIEQEKELEVMKEDRADARTDKEIAGREQVAYIQTFAKQADNLKDTNADAVPDLLEYDKLGAKTNADATKNQIAEEKNSLTRNKQIADKEMGIKKIQLEREKLASKEKIENKKLQIAKVLKSQKPTTKK